MDEQAVFEKVKAIIIDKLNADPAAIVPAARFREDLKADSLDLVDVVVVYPVVVFDYLVNGDDVHVVA